MLDIRGARDQGIGIALVVRDRQGRRNVTGRDKHAYGVTATDWSAERKAKTI